MVRTEPCACGGEITALGVDPEQIRWAVMRHNETPRHRAWSKWTTAAPPAPRHNAYEGQLDAVQNRLAAAAR